MADGGGIQFPEKLEFLFRPSRYKVAYGGRGGSKSWGFARALLLLGTAKKLRIVCAREFQKSINESVHQLLRDQIEALGLSHYYTVTDTYIEGKNGTLFTFHGLKHNVQNIKSLEGADIVWVEEANNVSTKSWEVLIPTIRKEGSEIWVSFNPELETDAAYQDFVLDTPVNAIVVKINWSDNPWFPQVLRDEMERLKSKDYDKYLHVWEGHTKQALDGAIYEDELRKVTKDGRICRVPYDPQYRVHRFWDLGWADNTAIWFVQFVGLEVRVIRHLSASRRTISSLLTEMQGFEYLYGEDWLPHDAESGNAASEGESVADILRKAQCDVHTVKRTKNVVADLDKVRTLFPRMLFDLQNTADGVQSLRRYVWNTDDEGNARGRQPKHDQYSHDADALRTLAMAIEQVSVGSVGYTKNRARSWRTA